MEEEITPAPPEGESKGNRRYIFLGIIIAAVLLLICCCLTIVLAWTYGDMFVEMMGIPVQ